MNWEKGDFNLNGWVDSGDYTTWADYFGCASTDGVEYGASASVPPLAAALAASGEDDLLAPASTGFDATAATGSVVVDVDLLASAAPVPATSPRPAARRAPMPTRATGSGLWARPSSRPGEEGLLAGLIIPDPISPAGAAPGEPAMLTS